MPTTGADRVEVVLIGQSREQGEDVAQISERLDPVALVGVYHRAEDRGALPGVGMTVKEPVLFSASGGADGVFATVVPLS